MKKLLYFVILINLSSCHPDVSVYLRNYTKSDLRVKVEISDDYYKSPYYPKFSMSDSLLADDLLHLTKVKDFFKESSVFYSPDSTWFYFTLEKGKTAFLSHVGFMEPSVQSFTITSPIGIETIKIPRTIKFKEEKVSEIYDITGDKKFYRNSIVFDIK
ncbi:MAG: hypothetical protein KTR26_21470 [Flammeovirgaceae bacterium]|nr:hypothetical protein [Flammeovirgaceae bacterium]